MQAYVNTYTHTSFCMYSNSYCLHAFTYTQTYTHIYLLGLNANQPRVAKLHSGTRALRPQSCSSISFSLIHTLSSNARAFAFAFALAFGFCFAVVALSNCISAYSACCCCCVDLVSSLRLPIGYWRLLLLLLLTKWPLPIA